jgi:hypothetical protein
MSTSTKRETGLDRAYRLPYDAPTRMTQGASPRSVVTARVDVRPADLGLLLLLGLLIPTGEPAI